MFLCELGRMVVAIFSRLVVEVSGERWRHRSLLESWRVGRRLSPELSEIEIGACAVAEIHGLVKLPLSPVPVEDHPIECNDNDFNHDFNDCADQGPRLLFRSDVPPSNSGLTTGSYLHSADQIIVYVVLVQFFPFPVLARPTPHILPVAILVSLVQDAGANSP